MSAFGAKADIGFSQAMGGGGRASAAQCCGRWALHSLSNPRASALLTTPGHSFLKSATQCLIANLSCAVAFDDHNIKMAPIIRMIFTTKVLPLSTAAIGTRRGSWTPTRKHL